MTAPFRVQTDHQDSTFSVTLQGELDLLSAPTIRDIVYEGLQAKPSVVVIDLKQLDFMDSSGLGALVQLHHQSEREGWELRLERPESERVQRLFEVTRTQRLFWND